MTRGEGFRITFLNLDPFGGARPAFEGGVEITAQGQP